MHTLHLIWNICLGQKRYIMPQQTYLFKPVGDACNNVLMGQWNAAQECTLTVPTWVGQLTYSSKRPSEVWIAQCHRQHFWSACGAKDWTCRIESSWQLGSGLAGAQSGMELLGKGMVSRLYPPNEGSLAGCDLQWGLNPEPTSCEGG